MSLSTPTGVPVVFHHPDGIVTFDGKGGVRGIVVAESTGRVYYEDVQIRHLALSPSFQLLGEGKTTRASVEQLAGIVGTHLGWIVEHPDRALETLRTDSSEWQEDVPDGIGKMNYVRGQLEDFLMQNGNKNLAHMYTPSKDERAIQGATIDGIYHRTGTDRIFVPPSRLDILAQQVQRCVIDIITELPN